MIISQIRLSNKCKEKLSRLKAKTGIQNWNILCRWAFCYSLSEETVPADVPIEADSNLEMSWYTFAGEYHEIYEALIKQWCRERGLSTDNDTAAKYFKLHLDRGIGYLTGTNFVKSRDDLVNLALKADVKNGNLS